MPKDTKHDGKQPRSGAAEKPRDKRLGELVAPEADAPTRLIQAGLEAFGLLAFEGASTRELARLAGTNQAAIPYHFGGKEPLYMAVVRHIAENLVAHAGPGLDRAQALLEDPNAAPAACVAEAQDFLERIARSMLLTPQARYWARIMLREQMMPTQAFPIIYENALGPALGVLRGLTARALDSPADDPGAGIRAFTLLGQVLVFRATQATVRTNMGWSEVGPEEFETIRRVIRDNVARMLAPATGEDA